MLTGDPLPPTPAPPLAATFTDELLPVERPLPPPAASAVGAAASANTVSVGMIDRVIRKSFSFCGLRG